MTTVFIYEYVTAIGARGDAESPLAPSLLREGRAMLDAVIADFQAVPDVNIRTIPFEDEPLFRDVAGRTDFSFVIAPEFDEILETRCRWVEESGGRLLGPSSEAVRLTADKLSLFRHFETLGIPTPRTWPLNEVPSDISPFVCKPRDGAGSQSMSLQCSPHAPREHTSPQARRVSKVREQMFPRLRVGLTESRPHIRRAEYIAQEYVEGVAMSVSFLIGPRECVALQPCTQQFSTDDEFRYLGGSTPLPVDQAARAIDLGRRAVESVPGLLGYVGVDLVLGSNAMEDRVIEINPRLTTSYIGLRLLADFNIPQLLLGIVQGMVSPEPRWRAGQVHFTPETGREACPT